MFKIKKFQICLGSGQQNLKFVYIKQKLACFRWVHFCFLVYKWTKQHLLWSFFLWSVHNFQQILFANLEHSGKVTFWSLWLWPLKKKLEKVHKLHLWDSISFKEIAISCTRRRHKIQKCILHTLHTYVSVFKWEG